MDLDIENEPQRRSLGLRRSSGSWRRFPDEIAFEPGPVDYLGVGDGMLEKENSLNKSVQEGKAKVCLHYGKESILAKDRTQSR